MEGIKDYYSILGLKTTATQDEIKKRFRELAFEYHPDVNVSENANDKFILINEAYQVLSDVKQKSYYDTLIQQETAKVENSSGKEFEQFKTKVRQTAQENARKDYRTYIKDLNCFYSAQHKADGTPFNYYMNLTLGMKGGTGPMGTIKSRLLCIPVPRSKMAATVHRIGFSIKLICFVTSLVLLKYFYPTEFSDMIKVLFSLGIILIGGGIVFLFYNIKGVQSKQYSKNFAIVKKYRSKVFQWGFHPMISTTPIGVIAFILRWLL